MAQLRTFRHSPLDTQRAGQTLVTVLWVVGMLSIALGGVTVQSMHELRLTQVPLAMLQGRATAHAALYHAMAVMQRDAIDVDHLGESWATGLDQDTQQPLFERMSVGAGTFSIGSVDPETQIWHAGLIDEERKLNLNTATAAHLQQVIDAVQPGGVDAQAVANALIDWRDEAVGAGCAEAQPLCHNGLLDSVEELRLVPGMTPELFAALEPYVTIYGSGAVNINTASVIVLNALGCDGEVLLGQRHEHPFTAAPASCPETVAQSTAFTAMIDAYNASTALVTHVRATFDRTGTILAWQPQ